MNLYLIHCALKGDINSEPNGHAFICATGEREAAALFRERHPTLDIVYLQMVVKNSPDDNEASTSYGGTQ